MIVSIAVANSGAIEQKRVIEQSSVAILRFAHALDQIGEALGAVLLHLLGFGDLLRIVLVMRHHVTAFGDAELRESAVGTFARKHIGDDAGHVGSESDYHQIAHQSGMFFEYFGYPDGT